MQLANWACQCQCVVLCSGMVSTRLPTAFLVLFKGGFTWREQVFMACSWIPKVTAFSAWLDLAHIVASAAVQMPPAMPADVVDKNFPSNIARF